MGYRHLSDSERNRIRELHNAGATYAEITKATGRSKSAAYYVLRGRDAAGVTNGKHNPAICPRCKKKLAIDVKIAFCYHCGEDLRSPGVKLVPEIEAVINNISKVYPENLRDHAIATLNKVITILKEE